MNSSNTRIDALLPAGGRISGTFAQAAGAEIKALIQFQGETILQSTIRTLASIDRIGRILVVGPRSIHSMALEAGAHAALQELDTGSANILRGIDWLQGQRDAAGRILVATTDMPFLTPAGVTTFLDSCPADTDICVSVVEREPFERIYPDLVRTDTRLADGWFRLGGLFLLEPGTILRNRAHLESIFASRKSNLKMVRMIGMRFAVRYLTRRLTTEDIRYKVSSIIQCSAAVIKDAAPEIGFDIDLLEEYAYAASMLADDNFRRRESAD